MSERDWEQISKADIKLDLKKNTMRLTPYGTAQVLLVMGRVKVAMQNQSGMQKKSIVYMLKGQTESLVGKHNA